MSGGAARPRGAGGETEAGRGPAPAGAGRGRSPAGSPGAERLAGAGLVADPPRPGLQLVAGAARAPETQCWAPQVCGRSRVGVRLGGRQGSESGLSVVVSRVFLWDVPDAPRR